MLGHSDLKTTQIYTQVSIRQLKRIHAATHPAAKIEKEKAMEPVAGSRDPQKASDKDGEDEGDE